MEALLRDGCVLRTVACLFLAPSIAQPCRRRRTQLISVFAQQDQCVQERLCAQTPAAWSRVNQDDERHTIYDTVETLGWETVRGDTHQYGALSEACVRVYLSTRPTYGWR